MSLARKIAALFGAGTQLDPAVVPRLSGSVVQVQHTQVSAVSTGTATIPFDDTPPQNTEGNEYLTCSITPTLSTSILQVDVSVTLMSNIAGTPALITALFRDAGVGALAVNTVISPTANSPMILTIRHRVVAGSTAATIFKARAGANNAGTTTLNGNGGVRLFGGVLSSFITVTEIAA